MKTSETTGDTADKNTDGAEEEDGAKVIDLPELKLQSAKHGTISMRIKFVEDK